MSKKGTLITLIGADSRRGIRQNKKTSGAFRIKAIRPVARKEYAERPQEIR